MVSVTITQTLALQHEVNLKYLKEREWTLKFEFHIIFTCHEIGFF